ncbi:DinB family protein [Chitinophaga sp. GCM10012297]|uniref:DinB family protein n=1 Tax=Chitinophaga chungangae TaxID=2821488 RepID=A0ABS3Y828_9BACT|nr:DinB family protein [Chitinophaga chungangae]MBO9150832.1 DinB family protein [Chitinophaga chungangae]
MATPNRPEVWQRGPVEGIPLLLQPVAHALLHAGEELDALMQGFDENLLWEKPAGVASPGFHLQHLSGVIDRLLTYARGETLSPEQMELLRLENVAPQPGLTVPALLSRFHEQVRLALQQLSNTNEATLTDFRGIGRKQVPTNVIGLLVHAAEHTMRHIGQLNVTVRVLSGLSR